MHRILNGRIDKVHVARTRKSCKCNITLVVVVGGGLERVEGCVFETWVSHG